ncbi:hypothetical protein JXA80_08075 [bacterium]|nr:hypothetical protein [candidate division CSSED10-310 bacterium]
MKYSYRLVIWAALIDAVLAMSCVFATDFPGPDADIYAGFQLPYTFVDARNQIDDCVAGCDDTIWARPIGFNFIYRGTSYSTIYVSVNGYISFTDSGHDYTNTTIPNPAGPPDMIAALWDDLMIYPSDGGIWEDLWGTAPDRHYVIQWWDVSERQNEASNLSFAIVLHESTGVIEFIYYELNQMPMDITIGIEDSTQTKGILGYYEGTTYGTFGGLPASYTGYQFQPAPNLTSYAPAGWYGPIVPRNTSDTSISFAPLPSILYGWGIGGTTYQNFLGHENRGYPVPVMGEIEFEIDNILRVVLQFPPQSIGNFYYGWINNPHDVAGGRHMLTITHDSTHVIPESDETDNVYSEQFVWSPLTLSNDVPFISPYAAPSSGIMGIINVDGYQKL